MKRIFTLLLLIVSAIGIAQAQSIIEADEIQLKKVMELVMPEGMGTNGAGVAWNPVNKIYYAAFAGNTEYPLAIFDSKGNRISKDEMLTNFDVRGIWYNSKRKTLQMNGFSDQGWAEYLLDSKGFPAYLKTLFDGKNQPDAQSVGAYNERLELVYFLNEKGNIDVYDLNTGKQLGSKPLHLNCENMDDLKKYDNETELEVYNKTLLYTGVKNGEFVLQAKESRVLAYYSSETGMATTLAILPEDAPISESLNLSYANGIFWIFDKANRKWIGYR